MTDHSRFSDPELIKFHQEFDTLRKDFDKHASEEREVMQTIIDTQSENTEAIKTIAKNTEWASNFGSDVETVARFSKGVQRIATFLTSIAVIGGAIAYLLDYLSKN